MRLLLLLLLSSPLAALAQVGEPERHRIPELDSDKLGLKGATAWYTVALPDKYDKTRAYPLLIDLHGAAPPSLGAAAMLYKRAWHALARRMGWIIAAPNGRFRSWGRWGAEHDVKYVLAVRDRVKRAHKVDPERVYLSGFSSGANFACSRVIQARGGFAGTLVVCGGPNLHRSFTKADGQAAFAKTKRHPVVFVVGEEDYIRKDASWQLFRDLDGRGQPAMLREVPGKAHADPGQDEYARALAYLAWLADPKQPFDREAAATAAEQRGDWLLATTLYAQMKAAGATKRLTAAGRRALDAALALDATAHPGQAYETLWNLRHRLHRLGTLSAEADKALAGIETAIKAAGQKLSTARRDWFRARARR